MTDNAARPGEMELIARYFAPLAAHKGARGLKDDAAGITPPEGHELVVTTDTLIAGVHFFGNEPAETLAAKALRVNLSDLTAKGAAPIGYLLSLSLQADWTQAWLADFVKGLAGDQERYGWSLLGGDTTKTPGPLTITVTAIGSLPAGDYVARDTARAGDRIYVTGTIGDAATGYMLLKDDKRAGDLGLENDAPVLMSLYLAPRPPVAVIAPLRAHARAAMDISDGLAGDCEKMCAASSVSAVIEASRVPLSKPLQRAVAARPDWLETAITGGDDYQVLAAVPPDKAAAFEKDAAAAGVAVTSIGQFGQGGDCAVTVLGLDGEPMSLTHKSYSHF